MPTGKEAKIERVADVIRADAQLAGCTTVAGLCSARPDVGSVLHGGNYLGPEHGLGNGSGLACTVGALYVAKCCFVPASTDTCMLLAHTATVADLKRQFYSHDPRPVAAALAAHGLSASTEQACVDALVCKDADGNILADTNRLPISNATACADVGCHAAFFLDMQPLSMRKNHVEPRIKASSSAIAELMHAPHSLGTYAYRGRVTSTRNFPSFALVRSELAARLKVSTRAVPARISAAELEGVREVFRLLEEDGECQSDLPRAICRYAQDLIQDIEASRFNALDPDFPTRISEHLAELKEAVEELMRLQTDVEWINYETTTEHPAEMSVDEIASKVEEGQGHVQELEKIQLLEVERTPGQMDHTRVECEEFADRFEALYGIFERIRTTLADLSQKSIEYATTCDESLCQAKEADAIFRTTLQDERANVEELTAVKEEHASLHGMTGEQIKWSKDSIARSNSDNNKTINGLDREMQRLQALKQDLLVRQEHLDKCDKHLDMVQEAEDTDADVFDTEWAAAYSDAQQRVQRSAAGVEQSALFVARLEALHSEVQLELKDAADYHDVLIKQVGVDCHATFLNTGKFLAIQAAMAEKNQNRAQVTHEAKSRASLEANALRDADCEDTLERAKQAEDELKKAGTNLHKSVEKIAKNKDERDKLKHKVEGVHSFLRALSQSPSPRGAKVVVSNLPDLDAFRSVSSVAEYREYRDDLAVSRPSAAATSQTLEPLENYERDFERRYHGETEGNLTNRTAEAGRRMWQFMIGR